MKIHYIDNNGKIVKPRQIIDDINTVIEKALNKKYRMFKGAIKDLKKMRPNYHQYWLMIFLLWFLKKFQKR